MPSLIELSCFFWPSLALILNGLSLEPVSSFLDSIGLLLRSFGPPDQRNKMKEEKTT